ncbi:ABC transporter ATP-binding protein [Parasutterella muris]|jgi:ABC-type cobalamin/Fe3+-siderophores transport systems, ATPase components|uniref:ATP-binding cassette domain-containing protein n=4 Tax=Parasutterella TaxID=577310 RepID=A0A6L6YK29_9BURK|nr:ABC transporter ATP-binding protein [Parasutterella muris]MVX57119.1 ATP-binding cassette domain-containing protein [Parasutterella muris]
MATLQIDSLSCAYKGKPVLNCVHAEFSSGRLTAILGRNGAGKTTLIRCIAGLHDYCGKVRLTDKEKVLDRSHIAYLPQLEKITSSLTAFETILLGLTKQLTWKVSQEQLQKVSDVIRELKLEALADTPVKSLSGGQKQLVFLAQAFVSEPKILLLDEPTSALDIRHQLVVMDTVAKYCKEKDAIALFVIHDLMLASRYSDSILFLHDGKVHALDRPENVLHSSVIDPIYQIESLIEKNSLGLTTLTPIRPL